MRYQSASFNFSDSPLALIINIKKTKLISGIEHFPRKTSQFIIVDRMFELIFHVWMAALFGNYDVHLLIYYCFSI